MQRQEKETGRLEDINQVRCDRAKIFAPFSPLRGLDEAYREKERIITPKAHLLSDRIEEINLKLTNLKIGDTAKIRYYFDGEYRTICGKVNAVTGSKTLKISSADIDFCDIYDIEILEDVRDN